MTPARLGALLVLVLSAGAFGHPVHESIAEAHFDAGRGVFEVAMRLDAEHFEEVLSRRHGAPVRLETPEAIDRIVAELRRTFQLRRNATAGRMVFVGREVEGQSLWLYFEIDLPPGDDAVEMRIGTLCDHLPKQVNTINAFAGDGARSLTFTNGDTGWKTLPLPVPVSRGHRPNIVLFLVDDLGWQDLSLAFGPEPTPFNDRYRTPNVERLAREGMRFTQAYASSPVCTPTRVSIMTGQSPARHHVTNWVLHAGVDQSARHATLKPPAWNTVGLAPEDVTLARVLRDGGYRTIHVGKAHWGAKGSGGADPLRLGFDVNVAGHAAGGPGSHLGVHHFSATKRPNPGGAVWDVPGLEAYHGKSVYLTEALTNEAIAAVEESVESGRPFFLNLAHYAVHAPIQADPAYVGNYPALDPTEAAYASMVEGVDTSLGRVLDTLDRLHVSDWTVVVFYSDNGGLSAHGRGGERHTHNAPLRSGKGSAYEGGIRVPLVVRWPGVIAADRRTDAMMIAEDLFPTLLGAAGLSPSTAITDGVDLGPVLRGGEGKKRLLVWHYPHQWGAAGPGIAPFSAVRYGPHKLIYWHADQTCELYDLASDLEERDDLAATRTLLREELLIRLGVELTERGAQMSVPHDGKPLAIP